MAAGFISPWSGANDVDEYGRPRKTSIGGIGLTPSRPAPTPAQSTGTAPAPTSPIAASYGLYNQGVQQQAGDYSNIMKGFQDLYAKAAAQPMISTAQTYVPQTYNYAPSQNYSNALLKLNTLADTGGYSEQDKQDIRARGISPIRAVYANAQRGLDRQRAIQGGYSPNYAAASAKMAREMSDLISGKVTDINAGLAERIAQNRIGLAPALTGTTAEQSNIANQIGQRNMDVTNEANRYNIEAPMRVGQFNQGVSDAALRALEGQRSLYGTTPALSSLFGSQALSAAQLQNIINQQGQAGALQAIGYGMR